MIFKVFVLILLSVFVSSNVLVDPSEAKIIVCFGSSSSQSCNISDVTCLLQCQTFADTHVYIHGFGESPDNESVLTIGDAYANSQKNLWVLDWSAFVKSSDNTTVTDYIAADLNAINLAPWLAKAFVALFNAGLPKNNLTIVGHSLGGQLAGLFGRAFTQLTNGQQLYGIKGLDPAAPAYLPQNIVPYIQTLRKNDAICVEIIHTGSPNYGSAAPTGDVDHYPNCGLQGQPGCPSGIIIPFSAADLCSHQMSWRFWAEFIKYTDDPKFYAFPVTSCSLFLLYGIESLKSSAIVMGTGCLVGARGTYYLKTNPQPRYAKGFDGY